MFESRMRSQLLALLQDRAWFECAEGFTLSAGGRDPVYIDTYQALLRPEGACLFAEVICEAAMRYQVRRIGGLALAAAPIVGAAVALSYRLKEEGSPRHPVQGFIVRQDPKDHGRGLLIEGPPLTEGDRCLLVDGVLTTGRALSVAAAAVEGAGGQVAGGIVLVDREQGGLAALSRYEITPVFTLTELKKEPEPDPVTRPRPGVH